MNPATDTMCGSLQTPLAVIGMACRLPGADSLDEYWRLMAEGRCAIGKLPPDRLDRGLYYDPRKGVLGKTYSELGGVVPIGPFDPENCLLPPEIIGSSDAAHLAGCQVAIEACRHARMDPRDMPLRNVGVFVGHTGGTETAADLVAAMRAEDIAGSLKDVPGIGRSAPGNADRWTREAAAAIRRSMADGRRKGATNVSAHPAATLISRALGLTGPAMVLNAACSSSLLAMGMAGQALARGRIDMAIVGGTSYSKWDNLLLFSKAQAISAGGSRPFDADADGMVASDGYVFFAVKTLARALADRDCILAVIRGLGISSDGRGKSLWAPRKEGQIEAIRRAYAAGLEMDRLQYVEAHASSTPVGDPTEIGALIAALRPGLKPGARIPVGSVKANIGHSLEAAGGAGLVKVILALQHGLIPRQIHFEKPDPAIDWQNCPFFVSREDIPWTPNADGSPRRAAVDAFGIGGLNGHLVVDEFLSGPASRAWPAGAASPAAMPAADEAVAIIGAGCVLPGARDFEAFQDLIASGRDARTPMPADRAAGHAPSSLGHPPFGGFIADFQYDWKRHKIPPLQVARADPLQFMVLDAADAALAQAGVDLQKCDRRRVAVIVGAQSGGDFADQLWTSMRIPGYQRALAKVLRAGGVPEEETDRLVEEFGQTLRERMPALLDDSGSFSTSTLASRISKVHDLMGGAVAIDAGAASSLAAVDTAVHSLLTGASDLVICAGAQRLMGPAIYKELAHAEVPGEAAMRDRGGAASGGLVPGEGAAVVLLKRLADARRDGDRVLAVIRGVGAACGAVPDDAVHAAVERTRPLSGAGADAVVLVDSASTAPPPRTGAPRRAVPADARIAPVGCLAGQIGHTLGASGMASVIKAVLVLQRGELPLAAVRNTDACGVAYRLVLERGAPAAGPGSAAGPVAGARGRDGPGCHEAPAAGVCRRFVMRLADAPLSDASRDDPAWAGPSMVLGDGPVAEALVRALRSKGATVFRLPIGATADTTLRSLEKAWAARPIPHLFIVTGREADGPWIDSPAGWEARRRRGVLLPCLACQRFVQLAADLPEVEWCSIVASVSLGGDFGFGRAPEAPEGGSLAGLLKSVRVEAARGRMKGLRVKVVDAPVDEPPGRLAECLVREACQRDKEIEVCYSDGLRRAVRTVEKPLESMPAARPGRGGAWVFTGGARGITASAALAMGQRLGFKAHLLGRSPLPDGRQPWLSMSDEELRLLKRQVTRDALAQGTTPAARWLAIQKEVELSRNLRAFAEAGVAVTYHSCDVTRRDDLAAVLAAVRAADGPIEGVVHGAGVLGASRRFEAVSAADFEAMLAVKADATLALMELTAGDPLRHFVAFSSISARLGANGHTDYAAANELMAKMVGWFRTRRAGCRAVAVHWPPWDEIGMMNAPQSFGSRSVMKLALMSPAEGQRRLLDEILAGLPESEVLIADPRYGESLLGDADEDRVAAPHPAPAHAVRR